MIKKASKEDIKVSLRSKWKNMGNICIPFVEIKTFEHLPMSFLAIHSVICFRHFSSYKKNTSRKHFYRNVLLQASLWVLCGEVKITWRATCWSLEKSICSNYQNIMIWLFILFDWLFCVSGWIKYLICHFKGLAQYHHRLLSL